MDNSPVDYQAALDRFRKEEHKPVNPARSPGKPVFPSLVSGIVDYQAAVRAWNKQQAGKYVICTDEHEDEGNL